ncbi:EAL domain-containing protein [Sphingobium subterraneum]|uniref:EAL domain-containing protein (Putative c-di-GMP-specific phosphodiesterase class I)/GGDEF domain-containing protein n=1 Tax=Sphingobium subterraneum TaxID=627688 RepID=A0A841J0S3_9SPHN|nr:EAL domain-containing protein (putative c-di-GMP-specific phosphodiesterase class I)/GGDEF domain-containing protein [Sphingobium subterraneum]
MAFGAGATFATTAIAAAQGVMWVAALTAILFAVALMITLGSARHHYRQLVSLARQICGSGSDTHQGGDPKGLMQQLASGAHILTLDAERLKHRTPRRHKVTGFPTRELLLAAMSEGQPSEHPRVLGVIELLDFDRLSAIDSTVATQILRETALRLSRMTGNRHLIAQIDRARFAIWFDEAPPGNIKSELHAICYALRDKVEIAEHAVFPQIRGAYVVELLPFSPPEMLERAIAALSQVTRGEIGLGKADPAERARAQFYLEQDLRQAVDRGQFELRYQPFVDAVAQRVCGAEALLRWQHPEHGLISPIEFMPIVEASGLAEEVGLWAMNAGCRDARRWEQQGVTDCVVAINLSAHQLDRADLDVIVRRTLDHHGLLAKQLELELTETVAAGDSSKAKTLFDSLHALGVSISIDDFGAGYSSLSYLKKLHFDKLKIDREFVSMVDSDPDSQAICQSIIALARGLGIAVLAEGVEREEEYHWLRRHGCTLFQGYYFARPMDLASFIAFATDDAHLRQLTDLSPAALQRRIMMSAL